MDYWGLPQVLTSERPSDEERVVACLQGNRRSEVRAGGVPAHNESVGEGHTESRCILGDLVTVIRSS